ncbi:MAG: hypothetical protein K2X99_08665, partial [Gemmatimonadaceae bacterium]|nr:hypothetical protein [Gemmatimonadaceae bacterium]
IVRDYRALMGTVVNVEPNALRLTVGARVQAVIARASIEEVRRATWRELPPDTEPSYLRPTQPGDPNVVVRFRFPVRVTVAGLIPREVRVLGLSLDDPDGFVAALQ